MPSPSFVLQPRHQAEVRARNLLLRVRQDHQARLTPRHHHLGARNTQSVVSWDLRLFSPLDHFDHLKFGPCDSLNLSKRDTWFAPHDSPPSDPGHIGRKQGLAWPVASSRRGDSTTKVNLRRAVKDQCFRCYFTERPTVVTRSHVLVKVSRCAS